MLERLGLVIHWVGFLAGVISVIFFFLLGGDLTITLFFSTFSFVIFSVCSWAIRYILAGKVHFLPWR